MLTPALRPAQIDFSKVVARIDDVRVWVEAKLKDTLGVEDDVVEEMVMGLLQEGGKQGPDPKVMQVSLSGFLEKNAKRFMRDLWKYLRDVAEGKTAAAAAVRGLPGPAAGAGAWGVPQLGAPVAAMGQTSVGVPPAAPALGMVPPPPPARGPVQVAPPPPPPPPPVQLLAPGAKPKRRRWDVDAPAAAAEGAARAATLAASQAGTGSAEDAARAAALAAARGNAANVGTAEQQRERQQRGGEHAGAGSQALDDEGGGGPREGEVGGERGARFPSSLPLPPPPPISPSAKRSRWA